MGVISTKKWLVQYLESINENESDKGNLQRVYICKPLLNYFSEGSVFDIQEYLIENGMFPPSNKNYKWISKWIEDNVWGDLEKQFQLLKKDWYGPNVPVFVLPSNQFDKRLQRDFNGKTGISFSDKVFLFLSPGIAKQDIRALLIHEYNHICRLHALHSKEEDMTLLDSIVLEGIAEVAVEEREGKEALAKSSLLYSKEDAAFLAKKWLEPHNQIRRADPNHAMLLYGKGRLPTMLGYCVGYHLVSSYFNKEKMTIRELITIPTEEIRNRTDFFTK